MRLRRPTPTQAIDARLREATDQALGSLAAEDKFILANYYLDGRTLAEIARLLGVHESTISRKLEKITAATRKAILSGLMKRGMSRKEAEQTMDDRGHRTLRGCSPPINARKRPPNRSIIGQADGQVGSGKVGSGQ